MEPDAGEFDRVTRAVVASSADAIVAVDRDLTVLVWNAAAERLFGWRAEELIGRRPPIIPDELIAEYHAVLERVRSGGQVSIVTRRIHRDGRLLDVRIDTSALRDDSGHGVLLGWVSVCHLVVEDEVAKHHMAERARLVRRLGDLVGDITAELELPTVLDRIACCITELTGADAGALVVIEEPRLRLVSGDGLPESLRGSTASLASSLVGDLLRTGKKVMLATGETARLDELIWSEVPGLHTIGLSLASVGTQPYGALYALFATRRAGHAELEILELLAAHAGVAVGNAMRYQEVVRQRAHERAVIDASADGIAVLDGDGVVREWNPAATGLTGLSAEEAIGSPPPFPLPPSGERLTHQLTDGRWLNVVSAEIAETGEVVVDFRDVTRAKELEEAKDLFLATTGHELRTPITVVKGFASTLSNRWDHLTDTERRTAVEVIAERADSLSRLMDHLLLGSRAGDKALSVTIEGFDLGALIRGTTAGFRSLSDRHGVEVEVPDDLPAALGDPLATDIIIGQLLENAFKYSPHGGMISVRARLDGERREQVVVLVEDEGVGIAPGDHERIFDRFFQGEAGDRRRFGGVGLGLYIVRNLARAQGGDVTAHSRDSGGTRMRFVLPTTKDRHADSVTRR